MYVPATLFLPAKILAFALSSYLSWGSPGPGALTPEEPEAVVPEDDAVEEVEAPVELAFFLAGVLFARGLVSFSLAPGGFLAF